MNLNANLIYLYRKFVDKGNKTPKSYSNIEMDKPFIFYNLLNFMDDKTILEINYACKKFNELIKKNKDFHYILIKQQLENLKKKRVFNI